MYIIIIYDHICIHTFIIIYIIHVLYHIRILCIVPCNKLMNCFKNIRSNRCLLRVKIYVPLGV